MSGSPTSERWYLTGPLGISTAFDELTDAQSVDWSSVGTAIRHNLPDTLNLLDGRAAAANQGPGLSWWALNSGSPPRAVRLGMLTSRFVSTADGSGSGYLALHTKGTGGDVTEALRISERQHVGIGTPTPNARLSVVAPGANELAGTALGNTFRTSSGALDGTAGAEVPLASFGFMSAGNNTSLGIRARRVANGADWTTTAIALEVDVDNTLRVNGAGLWLLANANVGIGTPTPGARLDISGSAGAFQCCAPVPPTLSLAEGASTTGRRAWLQFHNAGEAEAYLRLTGGGPAGSGRDGARRFEINDNQGYNTGLAVAGDVWIAGKNALRGSDSWLRLNQDGAFPSGVHTPGVFAPGSLNVGGRGGYGNPGGGNAWFTGSLTIDGGVTLAGSLSVGGEAFFRANRTNISGFDGGARLGYHWVRTNGDDNEMWFAYAQAWPNRTDIPRRVEVAVPLWAPVLRQTSDARLKSNIRPLDGVLPRVASLRAVSYDRLHPDGSPATQGVREIGVIAQELETLFPELVAGGGEEHFKAVDYSGLTGVLVEAIKDLHARNEQLARRVTELETARVTGHPDARV
jgi:hypothetical protein